MFVLAQHMLPLLFAKIRQRAAKALKVAKSAKATKLELDAQKVENVSRISDQATGESFLWERFRSAELTNFVKICTQILWWQKRLEEELRRLQSEHETLSNVRYRRHHLLYPHCRFSLVCRSRSPGPISSPLPRRCRRICFVNFLELVSCP